MVVFWLSARLRNNREYDKDSKNDSGDGSEIDKKSLRPVLGDAGALQKCELLKETQGRVPNGQYVNGEPKYDVPRE